MATTKLLSNIKADSAKGKYDNYKDYLRARTGEIDKRFTRAYGLGENYTTNPMNAHFGSLRWNHSGPGLECYAEIQINGVAIHKIWIGGRLAVSEISRPVFFDKKLKKITKIEEDVKYECEIRPQSNYSGILRSEAEKAETRRIRRDRRHKKDKDNCGKIFTESETLFLEHCVFRRIVEDKLDLNRLTQDQFESILSEVPILTESDFGDQFYQLMTQLKGIFFDNAEMAKILGEIVLFIFSMSHADSPSHMIVAAYNMIKCFITLEDITHMYNFFPSIDFNQFKLAFFEKVKTEAVSDYVSKSSIFLTTFVHSTLITALRNIILTCVSWKWFGKGIATQFFDVLGKPEKMSYLEAIQYLINQVAKLLQLGEGVVSSGDYLSLLTEFNPETAVLTKTKELLQFKDTLYHGRHVEGKMSVSKFVAECKETCAAADVILKKMHPSRAIKTELSSSSNTLRLAYLNNLSLLNNRNRIPPFGMVFGGDPGVGKSNMMSYSAQVWCVRSRGDFKQSYIYHRNAVSEYWEQYDPDCNPIIHGSEIGNEADDIIRSRGDPRVAEMCTLMDSQAFPVNTAALETKSKIFARPEYIMIDTNNVDMNLTLTTKNKSAHERRFYYTIMKVKEEFVTVGGTGLDKKKSLLSDDPILDRWHFDVYHYITSGNTESTKVYDLQGADIYAWTKLYETCIDKHLEQQHEIYDRMKRECSYALYTSDFKCPGVVNPKVKYDKTFVHETEDDVSEHTSGSDYDEEKAILSESGSAERKDEVSALCMTLDNLSETEKELNKIRMEFIGDADDSKELQEWLYLYKQQITKAEAQLRILDKDAAELRRKICNNGGLKKDCPLLDNVDYNILVSRYTVENAKIDLLKYEKKSMWDGVQRSWSWLSTVGRWTFWFSSFKMLYWLCYFSPKGGQWISKMFFKSKADQAYDFLSYYMCGWYWPDMKMPAERSHVFGFKKETVLGALGSLAVALGFAYMYCKSEKKRIIGEAKTQLYMESEHNDTIGEYEEKYEMGESYVRIFNKAGDWCNNQVVETTERAHKGDADSIYNAIKQNVRDVIVVRNGQELKTRIIGLKDNFALCNAHALGEAADKIRVLEGGSIHKPIWKDTVTSEINCDYIGGDLVVVALSAVRFKDITKHIGDGKVPLGAYTACFRNKALRAKLGGKIVLTDSITEEEYEIPNAWVYEFTEHAPGDCGTPLTVQVNAGSSWEAIHAGGRGTYGYAVPLCKQSIMGAIIRLEQNGLMPIMGVDRVVTESLVSPHSGSPFKHMLAHGAKYFGRLDRQVHMNQKSSLRKSLIADQAACLLQSVVGDRTQTFAAPLMKAYMRGNEWISPFNIFLDKVSSQKKSLDLGILNKVIDIYSKRIIKKLKRRGVRMHPLNLGCAVNGSSVDSNIRRVNAATAAGHGLPGKKADHLILQDLADAYIREPTDTVKEMLLGAIDKYASQVGVCPKYRLALKDEARDILKVVQGKTRPFAPTELVHLILMRMFLGLYYSMMMEHGDVFGTSIGINMHSDAHKIVALREFSRLIMEGDYGNYDQSMPFEIGWAAATVTLRVLEAFGYNADALQIVRGLLSDNLFPIIDMNGDIFELAGFQPSGKYGTAEDNSLRGVIMLMYAWYSLEATRDHDFWDHVMPRTYGDDMLAAVKEAFAKFFNNRVYKKFCEDVYGMPFTSPSKCAEMEEFVSIEECSFLKRKFVYRPDLGKWVAQLDHNSLYKTLMWTLPSKVISPDVQMMGAASSVMWELALILQEEDHHKTRLSLQKTISEAYLLGENCELPLYRDIIDRIFPEVA